MSFIFVVARPTEDSIYIKYIEPKRGYEPGFDFESDLIGPLHFLGANNTKSTIAYVPECPIDPNILEPEVIIEEDYTEAIKCAVSLNVHFCQKTYKVAKRYLL